MQHCNADSRSAATLRRENSWPILHTDNMAITNYQINNPPVDNNNLADNENYQLSGQNASGVLRADDHVVNAMIAYQIAQ